MDTDLIFGPPIKIMPGLAYITGGIVVMRTIALRPGPDKHDCYIECDAANPDNPYVCYMVKANFKGDRSYSYPEIFATNFEHYHVINRNSSHALGNQFERSFVQISELDAYLVWKIATRLLE